MKPIFLCAILVGLASIACAQNPKAPAQASDPNQKATTFLSGRQMNILCVHKHDAGDAGSAILYKVQVLDANKLHGRIQVPRLSAIVVRFTNVNTFCYDYEAGITKETTFYANNMPGQLKNFFVGGLAPVFVAAGAGEFLKDQAQFKNHYDAYGSLGQLVIQVRKAFAESIDPKLVNAEIRKAVAANLRTVFGYTDRDVTKEDLTVRQSELEAGIGLLAKDLAKLREDSTPNDAAAYQTQRSIINDDEEAVSLLTGQLNNYSAAITNLAQVQSAPDEIERVIPLEAKYDEYEVTASVALLKPKPTESDVAVSPATTANTITIDITGNAQLDFSTGLVATHPVNHDYYIKLSGNQKIVTDGGARDPGIVPAVFVHYYTRPGPGQYAFGPTFGIDLSNGQNFMFGLGLVRAGAQRLTLVGGLTLNKLNLLNGDHVGQQVVNGSSIQFKQRYVSGFFFGVTFDLGG